MADKLSSSKHASILKNDIIPKLLDGKASATAQPKLMLLGGQPGAGKGGLRSDLKDSLPDPVEIDIDELRIFHPEYRNVVRADSATAASRVQADCSQWAAELFDEAIKRRLDIIYDGTMSISSKATGMAKDASKAGFGIEVHVVATSLDVSQQGVNGRFEQARKAYDPNDPNAVPPRTVPGGIQKSAYDNIPGTLKDLCETGVVSRMRVANRTGDSNCDLVGKAAVRRDGPKRATEALEAERNRVWTKTEIAEYMDRGDKIVQAMRDRNAPDKDIQKAANSRDAVVDKRKAELDAAQTKQDQWIRKLVTFDPANLAAVASLPKKKKVKLNAQKTKKGGSGQKASKGEGVPVIKSDRANQQKSRGDDKGKQKANVQLLEIDSAQTTRSGSP